MGRWIWCGVLVLSAITVWASPEGQASNARRFGEMIRGKKGKIEADLRSGKLTRVQAKARLEKLRSIKRREVQYFHSNGKHEITDVQRAGLEQEANAP